MQKLRYWEDYVCHMIREYLKTPEKLDVTTVTPFARSNWVAVQAVWYKLDELDKVLVESVCKEGTHRKFREIVEEYTQKTGTDYKKNVERYNRIIKLIAKTRQLI